MLYIDEDFKECMYNPLRGVGRPMEEMYTDLRDREGFLVGSFGVGVSRDLVIRWVMAVYQPESPLVKDFSDYKVRRYQAGLVVGFPVGSDGLFEEGYMRIVSGLNSKVNRLVVDFCRMLRDDDYTELRIYQDKLYEMFRQLSGGSEVKDDKVLLSNIEEIKRRIGLLRKKFFVGDDEARLLGEFTAVMDNGYIDMSREAIVRRIERGEDIYGEKFVPPYGREYVKRYRRDVNRDRFFGIFEGSGENVS